MEIILAREIGGLESIKENNCRVKNVIEGHGPFIKTFVVDVNKMYLLKIEIRNSKNRSTVATVDNYMFYIVCECGVFLHFFYLNDLKGKDYLPKKEFMSLLKMAPK